MKCSQVHQLSMLQGQDLNWMFLSTTGGPEVKVRVAVGDMVTARASENGTERQRSVGWRLEMEWTRSLEGKARRTPGKAPWN